MSTLLAALTHPLLGQHSLDRFKLHGEETSLPLVQEQARAPSAKNSLQIRGNSETLMMTVSAVLTFWSPSICEILMILRNISGGSSFRPNILLYPNMPDPAVRDAEKFTDLRRLGQR